MVRLLYIVKTMHAFSDSLLTVFVLITWGQFQDAVYGYILIAVAFYWTLQIKRLIQQQYFNSAWGAFKSIFKKWNKYGEK